MGSLEKLLNNKDNNSISKRERLQITREKAKLEKNLGSIAGLTRLPSALFVVDINKEHIAVAEAKRLNIPTFAIVDTNCNPDLIDFPIPGNDDASKSISLIVDYMCKAIEEGMQERKLDKDSQAEGQQKDVAESEVTGENTEKTAKRRPRRAVAKKTAEEE